LLGNPRPAAGGSDSLSFDGFLADCWLEGIGVQLVNESPKFLVTASMGIFFLASAIAGATIATANPYSGANFALAAIVSCPVYFLGVLASIRHLRLISFRSVLGWIALSLNLIAFGFTALLIGIGVTGNW
jgi:hypothetical protein